jgi:hypothetical protein
MSGKNGSDFEPDVEDLSSKATRNTTKETVKIIAHTEAGTTLEKVSILNKGSILPKSHDWDLEKRANLVRKSALINAQKSHVMYLLRKSLECTMETFNYSQIPCIDFN